VFSTNEKPNRWEEITTYHNYYEFRTTYDSASRFAHTLKTEPSTLMVDGECNKKGTMNLGRRRWWLVKADIRRPLAYAAVRQPAAGVPRVLDASPRPARRSGNAVDRQVLMLRRVGCGGRL
jgi:hypothetical protein